jgi:hypothetical protein
MELMFNEWLRIVPTVVSDKSTARGWQWHEFVDEDSVVSVDLEGRRRHES